MRNSGQNMVLRSEPPCTGICPKTTHPNKKSLRKQFSGLFVQTVLPLSFKSNKRHAERVWANCLPKLFSVGFIGVGGFLGWIFLPQAYSARGRSRHLLETPFSEPLLRTLLRTLFCCRTHSEAPSKNPSKNPSPEPSPEPSQNPS